MPLARSKVSPQGRISVPEDFRVVRRAGTFTFEDIHRRIFGTRAPKRQSLKQMKEGIGDYVSARHART
jgi:hypothetical protein